MKAGGENRAVTGASTRAGEWDGWEVGSTRWSKMCIEVEDVDGSGLIADDGNRSRLAEGGGTK